jgi:thioredoxin-dependent peroxiredoxin
MSRPDAVKFKGNPVTLAGSAVAVGQKAPDFKCVNSSLAPVSLGDSAGKARLFSVVPSLDTPVCSQQTRTLEKGLEALGDKVACYTVSLDLPFAQKRFCGAEGVKTMQTLSDVHDHSFGKNWGVLFEQSPLPIKLLARALFVVDKAGTVTHAEYVSEVTNEPNYTAAMDALKKAAG